MSYRRLLVMLIAMMAGMGCGGIDPATDAAVDAPDADVDPPVDAPDAAPVTSVIDLTSAGGRMQGGSLTLDFEIGHAVDQRRAAGGTYTLEANATLPP
ncbi:MAG: hypothetical protein F9K40_06325 [Kofleriaceae bacterium]|nr:MAG: hypothetical protein F9K40_06325 [Kofleriaceae bacterium]MBZ0237164.1 hypothetical protein [Kofleriaceae bacterium]